MEIALGLWLAASPFVFRYEASWGLLWIHDFVCALLIATLACVTHWRPLRRAHLTLLPIAAWLMVAGWWQTRGAGIDPLPAYQNWLLVGMTLAMLAVVPSEASAPPPGWRRGAPRGMGQRMGGRHDDGQTLDRGQRGP